MNKMAVRHVLFIEYLRLSGLATMTSLLSFMKLSLRNRALFTRAELTIKDNNDVIVANQVFDKENMALRDLKITWVCIVILFIS